jgi:hypothetical protein
VFATSRRLASRPLQPHEITAEDRAQRRAEAHESYARPLALLAGGELSAADLGAFPLIETLIRAAGKDAAGSSDLRLLPIDETYPATAAWRARIQALPGYERTYPPHWRAAR